MDGDCAPVEGLIDVSRQSDSAWLMLDQAHAIGVVGEDGCGLPDREAYQNIDIVMGTFGKALGTQGAFVAGNNDFIAYLRNFARHYVYSTAISPALARATSTAIDRMINSSRRVKLHENIAQFKRLSVQNELPVCESDTPIQPLLVSNDDDVVEASAYLQRLGLLVGAIRAPTVPKKCATTEDHLICQSQR